MNGMIMKLLDMLESANNDQAIKSALKVFTKSCGFERFAFLYTEGVNVKTFNTYPEPWQETYLKNNYSRTDPVITEGKRRRDTFTWSADEWSTRGSLPLRRFRDEAIGHGLRCGLTIPVQGCFGSTLMLTLSSKERKSNSSAVIDPREGLHVVLAIHYRIKMVAANTAVSPKRMLSPRESMCVVWAAKGKSTADTAVLTGINARTVQHYLDSAREKLDAKTLPQLIAIAKDSGLI